MRFRIAVLGLCALLAAASPGPSAALAAFPSDQCNKASSCAAAVASRYAPEQLVRNGGFEAPAIKKPWIPFFAGGKRKIPGWRVIQRTVDLVGTDWPAGRGAQSLGVNGFRPGWVTQRLPTEAGTTYRLTFLLWGDPNGPPPVSRLAVRWDLERVRLLKIDVREQSTWRRVRMLVPASKDGTSLGFRSRSGGNAGPTIDAVRVRPVANG
jgi:hypothetical protein